MRVIYKVTNLITNKIYIGKDSSNKKNYYGSGIAIKNSIMKHGIINFVKEIIDEAETLKELNLKEIYWIKHYRSNDPKIGYNRSEGGDGFSDFKIMNKESYEKGLQKRLLIYKSKEWSFNRSKDMTNYYSNDDNRELQSYRIKKYYDNRSDEEKSYFSNIRSKASKKSWLNNYKRKENLIKRLKYNNPMFNDDTKKKMSDNRRGGKNPAAVKIEVDNILYDSISEACISLKITRNSIVKRLKSKNYKNYKRLDMENKEENKEEKNINFQECAHLEVNDEYSELRKEGKDALSLIFNMQKSIQEDIYGYNFKDIQSSIKKLKAYIDMNEEAIRDEDRELQAALTGIHTYPNCWKPWKSKHNEAMERSLSDLTKDEMKELHMEWIDKLHFFISEGIAIGLTPELITNYYVSKNKENVDRQKRGY